MDDFLGVRSLIEPSVKRIVLSISKQISSDKIHESSVFVQAFIKQVARTAWINRGINTRSSNLLWLMAIARMRADQNRQKLKHP
jgi:hypothetical protein